MFRETNKNTFRASVDSQQAAEKGCKVVAFHECSITGYTFASRLSREELHSIAEPIPDGPSIQFLLQIAKKTEMTILAGLFERDGETLYNTYICVDGSGLVARYRKLHPFINPHLSAGNEYVLFEIHGWKCGILICYDNNVIENVRATALLGAEIIFMQHVTMCTPSTRPGAGFVDPQLWHRRAEDPTTLKTEFHGLKGRAWLMKWLPARAYDNAVYCVFSNPTGTDDDQLKNGCSMTLDPFGDILDESTKLGEDMAVALCARKRLTEAGGSRYRLARRPEPYGDVIGQAHQSQQNVAWLTGAPVKI
ncbi:carbon-nitrogen hydrolase [Aspergillus leporis]|uniref:Carbon-nitrogen hydrolase n=1 Tax=Aspergillus leporis TaxID=41062 RepID=A0A5N5XBF2_9EURO|nr:carbon-nitrogen hydrolase [Aspergillus leporis]